MPITDTNTMITPDWQNAYRKAMTDIATGTNYTRTLSALFPAPRAYDKDLYEFERKYSVNGEVPQVLRGGKAIDISGDKSIVYQFDPVIWKLKSGYMQVDLQRMGFLKGEERSRESLRAERVAKHIKRIEKSKNTHAIMSIRGGKIALPIYTGNGDTIYSDQNFGLIWSDSVGAGAFSTRMQTGVTPTSVDWSNSSTKIEAIQATIMDIFEMFDGKGINTADLTVYAGKEAWDAIVAKINAFTATTRPGAGFGYSIDRPDIYTIILGNFTIKRINDTTIINSVTYKTVEDKYITVMANSNYHDHVYMTPELVGFDSPIPNAPREVMNEDEDGWYVHTQARHFVCADTNAICTLKVVAG